MKEEPPTNEVADATDRIDILYQDKPRMEAYYYGFKPTGDKHVDAILSAVAWAGKGSHNTDMWTDTDGCGYGPCEDGESFVEVIQTAANRAAEHSRSCLEKQWDEAYTRGFYDREALTGASRDASEGATENPHRTEKK